MENQVHKLSIHQIELWLNDPVTKAYQSCIHGQIEKIGEYLKSGAFVNASSSTKTLSSAQAARGQREGLMYAACLEEVLKDCEVTENV